MITGKRLGLFLTLWVISFSSFGAVAVSIKPLAQLLSYPEYNAPAQVHSLNISRISAQVSSRIDNIDVRVGDQVEAGKLLVQLDCREYLAQRDAERAIRKQYQSQLKLATSRLKRSIDLHRRKSISDEKVETDETELNVLIAQAASQAQKLTQAELQVERCRIDAPFAGVVLQRLAGLGELALPGTELLELMQLDTLELIAQLRPEQLSDLPAGLSFGYQGQRYPVSLRRTLPVVDASARTRQLRLEFDQASAPTGAAGRLWWRSANGHLPADLLVQRNAQLGLMVLDAGQSIARFVVLPGAVEGQPLALSTQQVERLGLTLDSLVIVAGRQALNQGDTVKVRD